MKPSATERIEPSSAARRLRPRTPARNRGARLVALALPLLAVFAVREAHAQATRGAGLPRVASVSVEGVQTLSEGQIKKVLKTRTKSRFAFFQSKPLFRQDFLRSDIETIRQFAAQHGFLDPNVTGVAEPVADKNEVNVVFRVREGPRSFVDSVTVVGVHVLKPAELDKVITTKVREPFNPLKLNIDQQALALVYSDRGYFPIVNASWTHPESTVVRVRFDIVEGPIFHVGTVEIEGVAQVDTHVVEREILLEPGDYFSRDRMQRSSERLYDTGLFQLVDFAPAKVDTDSAVVGLRVRVRERKHRSVEGGVGIGSAEGLRVLGAWGHNNLWGKNHRLRAESRYSFGKLHRFHNSITYTHPWLLGTRFKGSVSPYFDQSEVEFRNAQFTQRRWGVGLAAKRDLSRFARASLGIDQQWSLAVTRPDLPDSELVGFDETQFSTNRFTLSWTYDQRDDAFDPHRGQLYESVGELAGKLLGGQGKFLKGKVSASRYVPLSPAATLAARVELGGISPYGETNNFTLSSVPITDLFRTGGATSVRGYPEQEILGADQTGGLMLILTNLEWRYRLSSVFGTAVFLDGGNVWSRPRDFHWENLTPSTSRGDGNDYRWSVGGGLRVRTPVGPVRFDLGYRLREVQEGFNVDGTPAIRRRGLAFHLSLGQAF